MKRQALNYIRNIIQCMTLLVTSQAFGAFTITTSVARVGTTVADNTDLTSGSFTAPSGALLLVLVQLDSPGIVDLNAAVSDSGGLTWTKIVESDPGTGSAQGGHVSAWYAQTTSSVARTVSVRRTTVLSANKLVSFKVYYLTGHDPNQPIGNSGGGGTTSNNISPVAYTSSVNNSRGFGAMNDWYARGVPTSTDTEEGQDFPGINSHMSLYKAADTATAGTAVTMNYDAGGSGAGDTNWIGFEVRPAPTGICASPAGVTGEIRWISGVSKVMYCDGSIWIDTTHTVGGGCGGTTAGTFNYNAGEYRFCNGTNWISMKGSVTTSCGGTTAGTLNFTSNYFRFCDGTNWYRVSP